MPQIPVAIFLAAFEPGGTERQMIEWMRRLVTAFGDLSQSELRRQHVLQPEAAQAGI